MTPVPHGGQEGRLLRLWEVSQQSFWTFLDLTSEVCVKAEGGDVCAAGA